VRHVALDGFSLRGVTAGSRAPWLAFRSAAWQSQYRLDGAQTGGERFSWADPCPGGWQKGGEVVNAPRELRTSGPSLDLRVVERGLVLHREPTGWGEPQAIALAVEDREDPPSVT